VVGSYRALRPASCETFRFPEPQEENAPPGETKNNGRENLSPSKERREREISEKTGEECDRAAKEGVKPSQPSPPGARKWSQTRLKNEKHVLRCPKTLQEVPRQVGGKKVSGGLGTPEKKRRTETQWSFEKKKRTVSEHGNGRMLDKKPAVTALLTEEQGHDEREESSSGVLAAIHASEEHKRGSRLRVASKG